MTDTTKTAEQFPYHVTISAKKVVGTQTSAVLSAEDEEHAIEQMLLIIDQYPEIQDAKVVNVYRFDESPKAKAISDMLQELNDKYGMHPSEALAMTDEPADEPKKLN